MSGEVLWMVAVGTKPAATVKLPSDGRLRDVEAVIGELRKRYPSFNGVPIVSVVPIACPYSLTEKGRRS